MATVDIMHWVPMTTDGFDLFTDQHNLIFLFDLISVVPDLSPTSLGKVLLWVVRFSAYNYTCVHIKGVHNVWDDLLVHWSSPVTVRRLFHIRILPSSDTSYFDWPSSTEITKAQELCDDSRPPNIVLSDGIWRNPVHSVWI